LISAYSLLLTEDHRFVLAVNAGSNSITVFRVNEDFSLARTTQRTTDGIGPNSIARHGDLIYVSNVDADGEFVGEPDQRGTITGFHLTEDGQLERLPKSTRNLVNRPSAIQFSSDGRHLVVASINAGAAGLETESVNELVVFRIDGQGRPSAGPVSTATSTELFNPEGRNLPSAIGFEIVEQGRHDYVVVTEAREFQADGAPPAFPALQTGSVSTWQLRPSGRLIPVDLDVLAGDDLFDGQRTACWIEFSADNEYFWVSNALESTLSTYSFDAGQIELIEEVAAAGTPPDPGDPFGTTDGWIDLWLSADGKFLYQLAGLNGSIVVFAVDGPDLTFVQEVQGDLPEVNTQGIVAF
jgi:6-phosphogluconolactonase (cycloisomerase 2 family)